MLFRSFSGISPRRIKKIAILYAGFPLLVTESRGDSRNFSQISAMADIVNTKGLPNAAGAVYNTDTDHP